jgi:large subunit ribosomal protein L21e
MSKRKGGTRRKTRYKLKRNKRQKGKLNLRKYLTEYKPGDRVMIKPDTIVQKGMPHPRFMGKTGFVMSKRGSCYEVSIKDFSKDKTLLIHPIHMERCKDAQS